MKINFSTKPIMKQWPVRRKKGLNALEKHNCRFAGDYYPFNWAIEVRATNLIFG
jgi:hypothetical protein